MRKAEQMKRYIVCAIALSVGVLGIGCQTYDGEVDRTATGALTGGALGAATGAIIGNQSGEVGEGMLIGGALGAIAGGMIGHSMDQSKRDKLARENPETLRRVEQGQPLTLSDVKALSKAGVGDDIIISQIRNSRSAYRLVTTEIIELKEAGVSERVIDFMINTPALYNTPSYKRY